jgi:hypothetical protein
MKRALIISIGLNCALVLALGVFKGQKAPSSTLISSETQTQSSEAPASGGTKPFRWDDIESTDYRAYIRNLRGIGCPEQTIRDLIAAELDGLYAPRRRVLEEELKRGNMAERESISQKLEELQGQKSSLMAVLFGVSPSTEQQWSKDLAVVSASKVMPPEDPVPISMPLVFQDIPSTLEVSPEQQQAIESLRERFLESIGGVNQDPNDATYREHWQANQPGADEDLRGIIGINSYQDYQIAVRAKAEP